MLEGHNYFAAFHRTKLIQTLRETVCEHKNARIHVKKRLVGLKRTSTEQMEMAFDDGTTAAADLVIGADGIRSVVRSLYVTDAPTFSGFVACRGLPPMDKVREVLLKDSDLPTIWTKHGSHVVAFHTIPTSLIIDIQYLPAETC